MSPVVEPKTPDAIAPAADPNADAGQVSGTKDPQQIEKEMSELRSYSNQLAEENTRLRRTVDVLGPELEKFKASHSDQADQDDSWIYDPRKAEQRIESIAERKFSELNKKRAEEDDGRIRVAFANKLLQKKTANVKEFAALENFILGEIQKDPNVIYRPDGHDVVYDRAKEAVKGLLAIAGNPSGSQSNAPSNSNRMSASVPSGQSSAPMPTDDSWWDRIKNVKV